MSKDTKQGLALYLDDDGKLRLSHLGVAAESSGEGLAPYQPFLTLDRDEAQDIAETLAQIAPSIDSETLVVCFVDGRGVSLSELLAQRKARRQQARDAGASGGSAGKVTTDEVWSLYAEYEAAGRPAHEIAGLIAQRKGITPHTVRYHLKKNGNKRR